MVEDLLPEVQTIQCDGIQIYLHFLLESTTHAQVLLLPTYPEKVILKKNLMSVECSAIDSELICFLIQHLVSMVHKILLTEIITGH